MKRFLLLAALLGPCVLSARAADSEEYFTVLGHEIARFAVAQAKVDVPHAIELAKAAAEKPAFTMVELVMDGPRPIFEVLYASPNGPSEVELDAVTGKAISLSPEPVTPDQIAEAARTREALSHSGIDLRRAIEVAAAEIKGGTVVRARADADGAAVEFAVEVLAEGAFKMVQVGPDGAVKHVGPSPDEPGGRCWTFDREPAGKPPAGWAMSYTNPDQGRAHWKVVDDPKPMTGPHSLKLLAESGPRTFNVAVATGTSYADVDVRTRLRPEHGMEDQGGGVVWRCKDANNYYVCRLNPLESNFRLYRVVEGQRHQLQSADVPSEPGTWYAIRAKMVGDHIMCFLNGRKLLDTHDDVIATSGMVGLWTKADASSSFDNIAVRDGVASKSDADPIAQPGAAPNDRSRDHDDDDG